MNEDKTKDMCKMQVRSVRYVHRIQNQMRM